MPFRRGLLLFTACTAVAVLHPSLAPAGQPTSATGGAASDTAPKVRKTATARTRKTHKPAHPAASTPATGEAASGTAAALPAPFRVAEADTGVVSDAGPPLQVAQAAPGAPNGQNPVPSNPVNPGAQENDQPLADIEVRRQELLLKQKDLPSAITEVGQREIEAAGNQSSTQSLLQLTVPAVHVYQAGPGQNMPVISVRGVRGQELATTLDGVPMQDLIQGGQGQFLNQSIGSNFNIEQIEAVDAYPGVAAPGVQGYGTVGGTLAYKSKRPSNEMYLDVFANYGSFHTDEVGFEANTGRIDELNGFKALLRYNQLETANYIENLNAKYRDMYFAFDQPYGGGLSSIKGTVIYNNDFGYVQSQPVPIPFLQQNGPFWNFPKSTTFERQENNYLTVILNNETVLDDNDDTFSLKLFFNRVGTEQDFYQNPGTFQVPAPGSSYYLFTQVPFNFYGYFATFGPSGSLYAPGFFTYNPSIFGYHFDKNNPAATNATGLNVSRETGGTYTYGASPRFNVYVPVDNDILPFNNSFVLGGLFAKETQPANQTYVWGNLDIPSINGYNSIDTATGGGGGGLQRVVVQGYFQDKIDFLDGKAHLEPGFTAEGAYAENRLAFVPAAFAASTLPNGAYKVKRFDRAILPYVGASYDFPYNITVYANAGESALFAPLQDYVLGVNGNTVAPGAAVLKAAEGGIRYNTEELYLNLDYFYQKESRAFGFFQNFITNFANYDNNGTQEFKGVEAATRYNVTPEVSLFGNAAYLLHKYLTTYNAFTSIYEDQFGLGIKGEPTSGVPDWTATFGVDYDKKNFLIDDDHVSARFFGYYTGTQYTTVDLLANDPLVIANPNNLAATVTNTKFKLDPYAIFNLDVNYTLPIQESYLKSLKFDLNIQNLFDTHYSAYFFNQITVFAGSYALGGQPFSDAIPGAPFSATFGITARFGPGT